MGVRVPPFAPTSPSGTPFAARSSDAVLLSASSPGLRRLCPPLAARGPDRPAAGLRDEDHRVGRSAPPGHRPAARASGRSPSAKAESAAVGEADTHRSLAGGREAASVSPLLSGNRHGSGRRQQDLHARHDPDVRVQGTHLLLLVRGEQVGIRSQPAAVPDRPVHEPVAGRAPPTHGANARITSSSARTGFRVSRSSQRWLLDPTAWRVFPDTSRSSYANFIERLNASPTEVLITTSSS